MHASATALAHCYLSRASDSLPYAPWSRLGRALGDSRRDRSGHQLTVPFRPARCSPSYVLPPYVSPPGHAPALAGACVRRGGDASGAAALLGACLCWASAAAQLRPHAHSLRGSRDLCWVFVLFLFLCFCPLSPCGPVALWPCRVVDPSRPDVVYNTKHPCIIRP